MSEPIIPLEYHALTRSGRRIFRRLLVMLRPQWGTIALAVICLLLSLPAELFPGLTWMYVTDRLILRHDTRATAWLASFAELPDDSRIENDAQRAIQLQIWWMTGKGALVERHSRGKRYLGIPDAARFFAASAELGSLLRGVARSGDSARLDDLFAQHATRVDGEARDQVRARLRSAGVPRDIAVLPPRIDAVFMDGKPADAQCVQVTDLDDQLLRDWSAL